MSIGELQFHADYLLGAIGREPRLDCISEKFRKQAQSLEEQGILYMIGDVKNGIYRQTSIAVGEGVLAAMKIYRYTEGECMIKVHASAGNEDIAIGIHR